MNLPFSQSDLLWGGGFAFLAVALLARLMLNRRNQILGELYQQVEAERIAQRAAERSDSQPKPKSKAA